MVEAARHQIFPLDQRPGHALRGTASSITAEQGDSRYGGVLTGTNGDAPFLLDSSYTITAEVEAPDGGGEGMLATQDGRIRRLGLPTCSKASQSSISGTCS
ncbi:MAG: hypothetical protein U1E17_06305 [Geminicoccaceae bacterium]